MPCVAASSASALFGAHRQHTRTSKQHNAIAIAVLLTALSVALLATQVAALLAAQAAGFVTNLLWSFVVPIIWYSFPAKISRTD